MPTTVALDEELLAQALELGGLPTRRATVHQALVEYVDRRKRLSALELFGSIDFDPEYDYKRDRRRI